MSIKTVFAVATLIVFATASSPGQNLLAFLETSPLGVQVDSLLLATSGGPEMVPTPGFGGTPDQTDTFDLGLRTLPRTITLHWTYQGKPIPPYEISGIVNDSWYLLPDTPARYKMVAPGAIEEPSTRPVLARFDASPNPFPRRTLLTLKLARPCRVEIELYDAIGTPVRTIAGADLEAGIHRFAWDGADAEGRAVAGGIYLARLVAGDEASVRKLILTD